MIDLTDFKSQLNGASVAVFGLGASGMASTKALVKAGIKTYVWDDRLQVVNDAVEIGAVAQNLTHNIPNDVSTLVLAPGVPLTHPTPHEVVTKAQNQKVEIISDIEILSRVTSGVQKIGITGTNGKSTTTSLIGHILSNANRSIAMGGNLGTAALDLAHLDSNSLYVLELSSYQLDLCPTFKPDISILLNITPDHLDRHGGIDGYARSKSKIFGPSSVSIISMDDPYCQNIARQIPDENRIEISLKTDSEIHVKDGLLFDTDQKVFDLNDLQNLRGDHNHQNAIAAYAACKASGLSIEHIIAGLQSFGGLKHRQNLVRTIGTVHFINDSKATNDEAAAKALSSFKNIYWIVGGQSKGSEYPACLPYFNRLKSAYVIGTDTNDLQNYLEQHNVDFHVVNDLKTAVSLANTDAQKSNTDCTVLLSPAAASWDQYTSFEHRGDDFESFVMAFNKAEVS